MLDGTVPTVITLIAAAALRRPIFALIGRILSSLSSSTGIFLASTICISAIGFAAWTSFTSKNLEEIYSAIILAVVISIPGFIAITQARKSR